MEIIKVRKEHQCQTCNKIIKVGTYAFQERFDAVTYAGRWYYCLKCAKVIVKELALEIDQHLKEVVK